MTQYGFNRHQSIGECLRRMQQTAKAAGVPAPFRARVEGEDIIPDPKGDTIVYPPAYLEMVRPES